MEAEVFTARREGDKHLAARGFDRCRLDVENAAHVRLGRVSYRVVTYDRYGRSVAMAWAGSVNLSCWQLRRGHAAYVAKWDNGGQLRRACS